MKYFKYIFILVFLAASCTKEIQIELPDYTPKLVVDGRIEPGVPPIIILTKSNDIYAATSLDEVVGTFVNNAVVKVYNGQDTVTLDELCSSTLPDNLKPQVAAFLGMTIEQLEEFDICAYTTLDPAYFGEIGRTYTLSINTEGKEYNAITSIQQPVPLDTAYFRNNNDGDLVDQGFIYAKSNDPAGLGNAYRWQTQRINDSPNGAASNGSFQSPSNAVWDDSFIEGLEYDFQFNDPSSYGAEVNEVLRGYFTVGDTVVVKFSAIDNDVFQFFRQKGNQIQNAGSPFASPAPIPSNLSGDALGIWAGYGVYLDTVVCE
jgi:hypothetical protein